MHNQELVTTNIRLTKEHLKALKEEAFREEKSVGFLLRELVKNHIEKKGKKSPAKRKINSLWDLPKLAVDMKDSKVASRVDDILYRSKKNG